MKIRLFLFVSLVIGIAGFSTCTQKSKQAIKVKASRLLELKNPVIPGYFADPSLIQYEGKFYVYVTADPWGTDFLSCWVSDNFKNWTFHTLNWPTKKACTTSRSEKGKVWAPSVVQRGDTFYMYVSVGSEVWCGKSNHPLGPWVNMLGDKPLIEGDTTKYYHVIDAEAFIDDDGKTYLYWGSGWNWINGHCFAAELNDDMKSFRNKPIEVTPGHYFEAPFMLKHNGKYYLTYSEGKTIDETYEVRYAVGDHPFGPFTEASNSPLLKVNDSLKVYGPGHHAIFSYGKEQYILYHRHRLPFAKGTAYRQTCIGKLTFDDTKEEINTVIPWQTQLFPDLSKEKKNYIPPKKVISSTASADFTIAENVLDNDYSTRWEADENDKIPSLTISFEEIVKPHIMEIRLEYPWKKYYWRVETSVDEKQWSLLADYTSEGISGSPIRVLVDKQCKLVRLSFTTSQSSIRPSIWEISFY